MRRVYPLILPAILALALGVPAASADLLRVPLQYGGQARIVITKEGRIKSILLKQQTVEIPEDYLAGKPGWPERFWWGKPTTIDGVEGRLFLSYLAPKVRSQVTVRLTHFTAKSARIAIREERVSSADGYQETFIPDSGSNDRTVSPEVLDPYSSKEVIETPVRRIALAARVTSRRGTLKLKFRFPHRASPRSDLLTELDLRFLPLDDRRWGLHVVTARRLVGEGDLVFTRKDSNHGVLSGSLKIRPFVD